MGRSQRSKPCSKCLQTSPTLYRVQHDESGEWIFVCPQCWITISTNNPFYVYGGTWKAQKKR